jgi:NAD(P) transhydrogenase subunit alpha
MVKPSAKTHKNSYEGTIMDLAAFQSILTVQNITVFVLAIFVGYHVVWNVTPALHTPLMAVTNAISGIIIVGALLQTEAIGGDEITLTSVIGAIAVFLASINIFGGFMVTRRMLEMFKKKAPKTNAANSADAAK